MGKFIHTDWIDEVIAERRADLLRYRRDGDSVRYRMTQIEISRLEDLKARAAKHTPLTDMAGACRITGYSDRQIRRMVKVGDLENVASRGHPRFRVPDLYLHMKPGHDAPPPEGAKADAPIMPQSGGDDFDVEEATEGIVRRRRAA